MLPALVLALLTADGANGQRLLDLGSSIENATAAPEGLETFAVDVDIDFVRSAPGRLELPTPDGRVLVADMTVFEDRGNGDAMWAGGVSDMGYESVVLTVKGDYLAGRFGEPGGAKYLISAGPDGQGQIVDTSVREPGAVEHVCPGGVLPPADDLRSTPLAQRVGGPGGGVVSESNHDVLDILVVYTPESEERWSRRRLTPAVAIQQSVDYLAQVFRNGQLGVTPNLVHFEEAPPLYGDHEPQDGEDSEWSCSHILGHMPADPDLARLRAEHDADMVHLFVWGAQGCSGIAYLLQKGRSAESFSGAAFGLTLPRSEYDATFAHEIGHNMGANHDPQNVSTTDFEAFRRDTAVYPYAFGHTDFLPIPNIDTIMSYGSGGVEPYFSTVRVSPRGWTLGIAGERENERAMQQTVHLAVQYSDFLEDASDPDPPPPDDVPAAPTRLTGRATGPASVRLTWLDQSDNEDGFEVHHRPDGGSWQTAAKLPADATSADVTGLDAGGRYDFRVRAYNDAGSADSNVVTVVLPAIEYTDCVPSSPQIVFEHGYTVSMCIEYERDGEVVQADAVDYELGSRESGLLYFFDPDNSEVLIKVLDACRVNDHRWVFVAPVTTLAFNLYVDETATGKRWQHRSPRGGATATPKSDLAAFPCEPAVASATVADSNAGVRGAELVDAGFPSAPKLLPSARVEPASPAPVRVSEPIRGGETAACEPQPVVTLRGGYTVNMCVEYTRDGETVVEEVKDYGLDSEQSAILYFFDRANAEVLIKVLDACTINDHRWVFVAPVTTLAFNLSIEPPGGGEPWTHENRLEETAATKSDLEAFACSP